MLEFKLNYFYNLYKDISIICTSDFKKMFKEKHGDFKYINELIVMIQKYQFKTYGDLLPNGIYIVRTQDRKIQYRNECARMNYRYGNKIERFKRKSKEEI